MEKRGCVLLPARSQVPGSGERAGARIVEFSADRGAVAVPESPPAKTLPFMVSLAIASRLRPLRVWPDERRVAHAFESRVCESRIRRSEVPGFCHCHGPWS